MADTRAAAGERRLAEELGRQDDDSHHGDPAERHCLTRRHLPGRPGPFGPAREQEDRAGEPEHGKQPQQLAQAQRRGSDEAGEQERVADGRADAQLLEHVARLARQEAIE